MVKLSRQEKKELLEMAMSSRLRRVYRIMAKNSRDMTVEEYLEFLTSASQILPDTSPRKHKKYRKVKI